MTTWSTSATGSGRSMGGSVDARARQLREQRARALDGVAVARHRNRRRQEVRRARLGEAVELLADRALVAHHGDVGGAARAPPVEHGAGRGARARDGGSPRRRPPPPPRGPPPPRPEAADPARRAPPP